MLLTKNRCRVRCRRRCCFGGDGACDDLIRPRNAHEFALHGREWCNDDVVLVLSEGVRAFLLEHTDHSKWLVLDANGLADWIDAITEEIRDDSLTENADLRATARI